MNDNTYYHSDSCNLTDLDELFKGESHLEALLKGRRWSRVRAKLNVTKENKNFLGISEK